MHKVALLGMLLAIPQGCVLGPNPTARHVAMAVDGAMVVGGITLSATANRSSPEFATGVADSVANSILTDVGAAMLIAGLVGLVVNLGIKPRHTPATSLQVSPAPSALAF